MAVRTSARKQPDTYFELVRKFPLTRIADKEHLHAAIKMIDVLLQKELDSGEQAYLDVLTDLVESYEERHEVIPDASEADVLRELLRTNKLTQDGLEKKVGISQSTVSARAYAPQTAHILRGRLISSRAGT